MKLKSLIPQLLMFIVLFVPTLEASLTPIMWAWAGILVFAATIILQKFYPSGTTPTGWTTITYVINGLMVAVQIFTVIKDEALLDPKGLTIAITFINSLVILLIRKYPNEPITTESDLVSFGNYLLGPERYDSVANHPQYPNNERIRERVSYVSHADLENWKASSKGGKQAVN